MVASFTSYNDEVLKEKVKLILVSKAVDINSYISATFSAES